MSLSEITAYCPVCAKKHVFMVRSELDPKLAEITRICDECIRRNLA